jgi:hypothetical protein
MWMEKLCSGVLRVLTPLGPRFLAPSLLQRIYLLWVFRHFHTLPFQVLSLRQRRLVDNLCTQQRFVSLSQPDGWDAPVLGTLERRPPVEMEALPPRRPSGRVSDPVAPLVADLQQRS